MIVAIDGPAGSGKSTVARALSHRLGFPLLDTGAMYRALTWLAVREGMELEDAEALAALARAEPVSFSSDDRVVIAGEEVTSAIREAEIDRLVPTVARHPQVRQVMRGRQRAFGAEGDAVIEGRDIGTVVAPGAEVKVFLVAEGMERARRRTADRPGVAAATLADDLHRRDEWDAVNTQAAPDAVLIDTTEMSVEAVVDAIAKLVEERRA